MSTHPDRADDVPAMLQPSSNTTDAQPSFFDLEVA